MNKYRRGKTDGTSLRELVQSLENDPPTSQQGTLVKIRSKLSQTNSIKEFHKAGGLKVILPLLEKPKLLDLTVSIIANCCLDVDAREWLLDNNGISPIVQAFKCLASESIQHRCCRALANLALSPRGAFLLHKESILSLVVKFLTETTDPLSQQTAIRAIRLLTGGSFYKSLLVEVEGVLPIVDLLKSDNPKVVLCALKTLSCLTEHCKPEIAQEVQRSQGVTAIVTLCSNEDLEYKENALVTLVNLSTQSVIRPVLGNAGAIPLLIKLVENPEIHRPNMLSLVTALCFYCRESANRVKIRDNDGLKVLINILRSKDSRGIHDRVLFSLLAFRYDEASLDVLMELGLIDVLVEHLNCYVSENKKEHFTIVETEENDAKSLPNSEATDLKTPKKFVSFCKASEISKDEESELLSVMKVAKLSKVFCIHSPSYQLVQNEVKLDRVVDVKDGDVKYRDVQSPSSVNSYCLSPDASSIDWSLPGSPSWSLPGSPSNYRPSSWSQSPSPTNMSSSSLQDFELSPVITPTNSIQYSPVLHDGNYSDVDTNYDFHESVTVPKQIASVSDPKQIASVSDPKQIASVSDPKQIASVSDPKQIASVSDPKQIASVSDPKQIASVSDPKQIASVIDPKPIASVSAPKQIASEKVINIEDDSKIQENEPQSSTSFLKDEGETEVISASSTIIPKRKRRKRTISDCSSPIGSKFSRPQSTASTCSSFSLDYRLAFNPNGGEEEATVGGQIIQLMSHLSHMEKYSASLATKTCVESILNYLCNLPFISPRAKRLALRLLGDYKCFEALILYNIIDVIEQNIILKHIPSECRFCTKLDIIKQKLKTVLSSVSESGYGIGILSHIILTGTSQEIAKCVLAIPHLIRGHYQLRKLLCDCGGLIQLLQLLDGENRQPAIQSLSVLCQNCFSHAFRNYSAPNSNGSKIPCAYDCIQHDVEFTLDDKAIVRGNRATLSANSVYFKAMLEGSFLESQSSNIKLESVSNNALLTIFHHLCGCNTLICSPFKVFCVDLSLELLTLSDRFMIDNFSKIVTDKLISNLSPENVKTIYAHSVKYNYENLSTAVLKYVMIGEMSATQRQDCFEDLKSSPTISKLFIGDIKETILKQFPESKIASKQLVEDK